MQGVELFIDKIRNNLNIVNRCLHRHLFHCPFPPVLLESNNKYAAPRRWMGDLLNDLLIILRR